MPRVHSFRKRGKVSLWVSVRKANHGSADDVDILKDCCGVSSYDLDDQELSAVDDTFPKTDIDELLEMLSYSSSFVEAARQAAAAKNVTKGYWVLAQFDFAYKPEKAIPPVAEEPLFLGVFDWNDSEDDE